ncbi:MAG TPA: DNA polymerase IV [Chromatiales bacterium]|nr:DNA polymerase IV [Chromatiales bacterium]
MNLTPWQRAIILVDMNAFFASIEQMDRPEWQGRAVGVTNGKRGTCVITCSYEARAWGVKTGMRLKEARKLCPDFIQAPARPERYAQVSRQIMEALTEITPEVEVFSVDEAFLDVTHCQSLWGHPETMAQMVKQKVYEASGGVLCSIGVSGDKTTAKYAAKLNKPNGLTVIPPWEAKARLADAPVTALCGIARGIGRFLAERGVITCGDMEKLPISVLARRFGNPGRRIWYMAQGLDPEPVITTVAPPKSVGPGKVMPPATKDENIILTFLLHMCAKVGARLRKYNLQARHFFFGLRTQEGWLAAKPRLSKPSSDTQEIYRLGEATIRAVWKGEGVHQIQVTALDPQPANRQPDFFINSDPKRDEMYQAVDRINERFGELALAPARLLNRSDMPNVISPAWKPDGHRQTI